MVAKITKKDVRTRDGGAFYPKLNTTVIRFSYRLSCSMHMGSERKWEKRSGNSGGCDRKDTGYLMHFWIHSRSFE